MVRSRSRANRALPRGRGAAALGLALLLLGCTSDPAPADCAASSPSGAVDDGWVVLWDGHGYRWERLSHRISFLRAGVDLPGDDGGFDGRMGLVGGPWSDGRAGADQPSFDLGYSHLRADGLSARYGSVGLQIGPDGEGSRTVVLDLDDLGIDGRQTYAIALSGICLQTDVPLAEGYDGGYDSGDGWTPSALGAGLSPAQVDGGQLVFDASLRFEAGTLDRKKMGEAVPFAQVDGVVGYVVLALDEAAVTAGRIDASGFYPSEGKSYTDIPPLPEEDRRLSLQGLPGRPVGAPLLRSWDIALNESDADRRGRYLRAWSARVEDFTYEPRTGVAEILADGYASHSSVLQEGDLEVRFSAEIDLLQTSGADDELLRGLARGSQDSLGAWDHPVDPGLASELGSARPSAGPAPTERGGQQHRKGPAPTR